MTFGVGLSCGKRGADPDSRAEARVGWDARSGCRRGGGWGKRGQGAGVGVKGWEGPSSEGTVPPWIPIACAGLARVVPPPQTDCYSQYGVASTTLWRGGGTGGRNSPVKF